VKPSGKTRFLPEDVKRADKLFHCLYTCTKRIADARTAAEMEYWDTEHHRCSSELKALMQAKEQHDKVTGIARNLRSRGIQVELVTRSSMISLDSGGALGRG